jgi:hypothetical protein
MQQNLWKSDADGDKPSHVRVRVFGCIVRVLTCFCSINNMYEVYKGIIRILECVCDNSILEIPFGVLSLGMVNIYGVQMELI